MSVRCSSRRAIPFACSLALLLVATRAPAQQPDEVLVGELARLLAAADARAFDPALLRAALGHAQPAVRRQAALAAGRDRKSTRLNSSHSQISYAVFCLKKKKLYAISNRVVRTS